LPPFNHFSAKKGVKTDAFKKGVTLCHNLAQPPIFREGITVCNFATDKQTEDKAKPLAFAI